MMHLCVIRTNIVAKGHIFYEQALEYNSPINSENQKHELRKWELRGLEFYMSDVSLTSPHSAYV